MNARVKLIKQMNDGRYIFENEGTYFVLSREQAESLVLKINEFEADKDEDHRN